MAINKEFLVANHADLVAEIRTEGSQAGRTEGYAAGAAAERARIAAVEAASMPGCEALVSQFKADGKTTGPEAAAAVLAEYKKQNATALDKLKTDAAPLANIAGSASAAGADAGDPKGPAKGSATEFDAAVAANVKAGLSRGKAIGKAAREFPDAHAAWIDLRNAA